MFNIVLVEPEIPQNTGNIARTCAATGSNLILVGKLGFKTDDRYLKRAGLDYWKHVNVIYKESFEEFLSETDLSKVFFFSKKANNNYSHPEYKKGDFLVFGRETYGLPDEIIQKYSNKCYKIPTKNVRSLNLSTSAAIVLYEALRQNDFQLN
ncbi:MAG: tRNA (cytidine(34)-2'-O)-methyltransferase [Candidatus Muiribacteriota bacterium]